jgi:hypothetical protein
MSRPELAALPPAEATVLFLTEGVGVPAEVVEGIAAGPEFGFMQQTAHTVSYDAALGRVSAPAGLARITAPTLVLDGGRQPGLDAGRRCGRGRHGPRRHVPHGARRGSRDPAPARGARRRDQSRVT